MPRKPGGHPPGGGQQQAREYRKQAELCRQEAAKLDQRAKTETGDQQADTLAKAAELRSAVDVWNAEATKTERGGRRRG
jgi:hypothetical protein